MVFAFAVIVIFSFCSHYPSAKIMLFLFKEIFTKKFCLKSYLPPRKKIEISIAAYPYSSLFIYNRSIRYSNESQTVDIGVYTTYDTDRQDTCEADNHTDTAVCVGSERTYRLVFGFVYIHCFDYHKVIIERYNGN